MSLNHRHLFSRKKRHRAQCRYIPTVLQLRRQSFHLMRFSIKKYSGKGYVILLYTLRHIIKHTMNAEGWWPTSQMAKSAGTKGELSEESNFRGKRNEVGWHKKYKWWNGKEKTHDVKKRHWVGAVMKVLGAQGFRFPGSPVTLPTWTNKMGAQHAS